MTARSRRRAFLLAVLLLSVHRYRAYVVHLRYIRRIEKFDRLFASSSATTTATEKSPKPRTGFAQSLLNLALSSPLWKLVLVPQARAKIASTAEANGIPWQQCKEWIKSEVAPDNEAIEKLMPKDVAVPSYYKQPFHSYEEGNLCWDAAYEVELASCAVGARNFPQFGSSGEDAFRNAFQKALTGEAGAVVPDRNAVIVDFGCGTGMSTRRLAKSYPHPNHKIIGIDLSPYFIKVGEKLLELAPTSCLHDGDGDGTWVSTVENDPRIEYRVGDISSSQMSRVLDSDFADVVNVQFVFHELPPHAAQKAIDQALRILKPGGQLWLCEMDFESPGYAAQRSNALLFSLIRSTEPYLDEYAESMPDLMTYIQDKFETVTVVAATGRHYALVATKDAGRSGGSPPARCKLDDQRFDENGLYRLEDTHLKLWESKDSTATNS